MSADEAARTPALERLHVFVGTWTMEASLAEGVVGRTTFEWALDGRFLLQRSEVPCAPSSIAIVAPDAAADTYTQHYFDSRGVVRIYRMTFDGAIWELVRTAPDFTPLDFCQRYVGEVRDGGRTVAGRWETSSDGASWTRDFDLAYHRVDEP